MVLINVFQGTAPLHTVGTAAVVVQVTGISWPQPSFTLLVTGLCRFRLEKLVMEVPYLVGVVTQLDKLAVDDGTSVVCSVKVIISGRKSIQKLKFVMYLRIELCVN